MQNIKKAFTLIELIVIMAIIMILALGASNINFNRATDKEFLNSWSNKVASSIEKTRNDALIGKGVGVDLDVPQSYKISLSSVGSGSINIFAMTGTVYQNIESIPRAAQESISPFTCYNPTLSSSGASNNVDIIIEKNTLSLSGCTVGGNAGSILEITTSFKSYLSQKISVNTLTGRVEKK